MADAAVGSVELEVGDCAAGDDRGIFRSLSDLHALFSTEVAAADMGERVVPAWSPILLVAICSTANRALLSQSTRHPHIRQRALGHAQVDCAEFNQHSMGAR